MIRLVIFQNAALHGWALQEALAPRKAIVVVGVATTPEQAIKLMRNDQLQHTGTILLTEIGTLERANFALLTNLAEIAVTTRVVTLIGSDDDHRSARALRLGCNGFVDQDASAEILLDALTQVTNGATVASPHISRLAENHADSPTAMLSQREVQVMEMLAKGQTNREIADSLSISIKTVDTHRGHVLKKLQLRNNSDLTRFAVKHGLVRA
ncbi:MAG: response regulator transcription factor [Kofleriaceae bacterium]|nr:response regulator transcription factor [Kofleriaceae bacterium]